MTRAGDGTAASRDEEAERYGIRRVTIEQFETGGYRYTNLEDALAEARRRQAKSEAS